MSPLPKVGFVGAGVMGLPMARRLQAAGHPLAVYARTPGKAAVLTRAGAALAESPAQLAASSDVIIGCLLDEDAAREVYLGPRGMASAIRTGHLIIEHGTFAPDAARAIAEHATTHGADFVDAPVTGGPQRARDGELVCMAGGRADAVDTARTLLSAYCRDLVHVGPAGTGLELKLVNQLLVTVHVAAAAEAAALLGRLGLPAGLAKSVLMSGWAASAMLDHCLPAALTPDTASAEATVGGLSAVQNAVAALTETHGLSLRVFPAARDAFSRLTASGAGDHDLAQLARIFDPADGAPPPLETTEAY
ncbi:3-hydroxyisobutyrate dehydrogenase-like beta-hydroxyacid dehydrogenase [Streptomyces aurantiacus]|uniref:NAD(P)-dependent oxidoreductase n=1 Tax=Streptomyces aurantiacus TaxID=47760 RepID=UPI00278EA022|nr:NAD(P)-dependent oxidoreductase [Streptomyces aurantiacus]MDQ0772802.1 3-hydroxyisobutyrate dehydrogenase-like beta-hydroxyacid dehydrogenase [Streptomyces aurantiacus]